MRFKKILIIPILLIAYIVFINRMVSGSLMPQFTTEEKQEASGAAVIGVGESVSVFVTRPYLLGLIRLPVYTNNLGYIGTYHSLFFWFLLFLTITFVIIEIINNWRRSEKWLKKKR